MGERDTTWGLLVGCVLTTIVAYAMGPVTWVHGLALVGGALLVLTFEYALDWYHRPVELE